MLELTETITLVAIMLLYPASWFLFLVGWRKNAVRYTDVAFYTALVGFLFHTALLIIRYVRAEHIPVITPFEFVCAFSFLVAAIFLTFCINARNRGLGVFLMPVILLLLFYAAPMDKTVQPEIMLFNGTVLKIHVVTVLVGYAFWVITFAASVCYLFLERRPNARPYVWDQMAYRAAFIAFCFHTAAIVTGALWADQIIGVLWSWDMKETWSFITWLIFLCYLHARYNRAWDGTRAAYLAIAGFAALVFTYVGVDYFLPQLHSMGT
jgi:ABC-type transport system involved in cytochrome c biogenesis permease subunit